MIIWVACEPNRLDAGNKDGAMKRAFTMIELLVVVSIVSILASILLPASAQAKEAAKQSSCVSSLHQIQLALLLYGGDFDGFAPPYTKTKSSVRPTAFCRGTLMNRGSSLM